MAMATAVPFMNGQWTVVCHWHYWLDAENLVFLGYKALIHFCSVDHFYNQRGACVRQGATPEDRCAARGPQRGLISTDFSAFCGRHPIRVSLGVRYTIE